MKIVSFSLIIGLLVSFTLTSHNTEYDSLIRQEAERRTLMKGSDKIKKSDPKQASLRKMRKQTVNKFTRLVQALKTIRKNRMNNRKKLTQKRATKRVALKRKNKKRHLAEEKISETVETSTTDNENIITNVENFMNNSVSGLGKISGFVPEKLGFDYSAENEQDYLITGLGTIGFSYGLFDYYSRKKDFKSIKNLLEDRYDINAIHNDALEKENSSLIFINKKLAYSKLKVERCKKEIEQGVQDFANPFMNR
jgi:hypothetical protein